MAGQLTIDTLKTSSGVLATQNGISGICRAFVNFNGTTATINGTAFNVSSVTRVSTGNYTVNFTTAMPDANYAVFVSADLGTMGATQTQGSRTTTSVSGLWSWRNDTSGMLDANSYWVSIHSV